MAEETNAPPGRGGQNVQSKAIVVILIGAIALGIGTWFAFDATRPVLDRETGRLFAAEFEKRCQRERDEQICTEIAGANHVECLASSASPADEGVAYDRNVYLTCMDAAALAEPASR